MTFHHRECHIVGPATFFPVIRHFFAIPNFFIKSIRHININDQSWHSIAIINELTTLNQSNLPSGAERIAPLFRAHMVAAAWHTMIALSARPHEIVSRSIGRSRRPARMCCSRAVVARNLELLATALPAHMVRSMVEMTAAS